MQVIPGWDFVPILCCSDVNPRCHILFLPRDLFRWVKRAFLDTFCSNHPPRFPFSSGSFLPYRVTHFILSFNCTKHTSSKPQTLKKKKKITGQENGMAGSLETSTAFAHAHTQTHSRTHLVSVSNAFPYIFSPVHPYTHNSLFIRSKSGHARPRSPRPNRPMNRNMSSA